MLNDHVALTLHREWLDAVERRAAVQRGLPGRSRRSRSPLSVLFGRVDRRPSPCVGPH